MIEPVYAPMWMELIFALVTIYLIMQLVWWLMDGLSYLKRSIEKQTWHVLIKNIRYTSLMASAIYFLWYTNTFDFHI